MQQGAFAGRDRRRHRDARRGEAAHAQDVVAVRVPLVTRVAHLDEVRPRLREAMLEPAVEVQARIVVAFGDDPVLIVADDDERIDLLAEAVADDLEADALAGRHVDGEAVHLRLAEATPQRRGQCHLSRSLRRVRSCSRRQVVDQAQARIAQPVAARDSQAEEANGSIGRHRHVEAALDGLRLQRSHRQRRPDVEEVRQPRADGCQARRLAALEHGRVEALDERLGTAGR